MPRDQFSKTDIINPTFSEWDRKSISISRTFRAISTREEAFEKLQELCTKLSSDMEKEDVSGKHITLTFKNTDFHVNSRGKTLSRYIHSADELLGEARQILCKEPVRELRLLGVKVADLEDRKALETRGLNKFIKKEAESTGVKRECPVCSKDLERYTIMDAKLHIDVCLQGDAPPSTPVSKPQKKSIPHSTTPKLTAFLKNENYQSPSRISPRAVSEPLQDVTASAEDRVSLTDGTDTKKEPQDTKVTAGGSPKGFFAKLPLASTPPSIPLSRAQQAKTDTRQCPICNRSLKGFDSLSVNRHIDACLAPKSQTKTKRPFDGSPSSVVSSSKRSKGRSRWRGR